MTHSKTSFLEETAKATQKLGIKNLTIIFSIIVIVIFVAIKMTGSRVSNISDTAKIGTMKIIDTAFKAQLQAGKDLPLPDDAVTIKIQNQILGYQGYVGANVSSKVDFLNNKEIQDKTYIYLLDPSKKKYQIMTWISKDKSKKISTGDYIVVGELEDQEPYFLGEELGMFFEPFTHVAIQDVIKTRNRDLTESSYPSIQRYNLEKVVETNPWVLVETMSGLDNKFRDKIDTEKMGNLVGRWKFDEGKGNIVRDSSKYKNNGVITGNGVSRVVKNGRKGLKFAGSGRVEIPDSDSLDLTDNFTIVVEFEQLGEERGTLISKDGVGTDTSWAYNVYADKKIAYETNNKKRKGGGNIFTGVLNKSIIRNQNGKLSLRQDGNNIMNSEDIISAKKLDTKLLFGRRGEENISYLNGIIYSIKIYK